MRSAKNQLLLVRFPNLGSDYVIVTGKASHFFSIKLDSTNDKNRTSVRNIGRAIVQKLAVKLEENEILSVDDFDVFACYWDLWKTKLEKRNAMKQGIVSDDGSLRTVLN